LDVSNNLNLTDLRCSGNELTSLDVSLNTNLTYLECGYNNLSVLDVTNLTSLVTLTCETTSVSSLNLTQNLALEYLRCSNTLLSSLDLTNNTLLETLYTNNAFLTSIDVSQNIVLRVAHFGYNLLNSLDVSQNTALEQLRCNDNQLTNINVSQNLSLTLLEVTRNMIDSLDLSYNVNLTTFGAYNNNLSYLNLKNGNNLSMSAITVGSNPDLYCVTVDDSLYSETTWRSVYPSYLGVGDQTVFNGDCENSCFVALRTNLFETTCESYSFNGQLLTSTGIYTDTLSSVSTCKDSIVKLDLTIINSSASSMSETACYSYTSPSGNYVWTTSNTYIDTMQNANGCDSIITVNLTIDTVDTFVTQAGGVLTANVTGSIYQWLDCDNSNVMITGETAQAFTATTNGNYAVEIIQNGCVDTSACYSVTGIVGVEVFENNFSNNLSLYPNPTNGQFNIDLGQEFEKSNIQILDLSGRVVYQTTTKKQKIVNLNFDAPAGVYFVRVSANENQSTIKLIKQ
ncbi:MAG: T9SS type A sorting domain-containing protein, partial [Vicingaceae bacterium]|nr:T9SS type A sorting domain-containing protein [Vicingaceae bacterium]